MTSRVKVRTPMPRLTFLPIALLAIGVAALVVANPLVMMLVLAGTTVVALMMLRIELAVLVYVAVEPFADYLKALSGSSIKVIGAILFGAWLLRLAMTSRRVALRHPAVYSAAALLLALFAAAVVHSNGSAGIEVASRYVSYIAVLFVMVDTLRNGLSARLVARVFVISCSVAAVFGLLEFMRSGGGRAAGPMGDANDFAFYLTCALPFAVYFWRHDKGRVRLLFGVASVVLMVAILATFSRGAVLGIIAMIAVAAWWGILRFRVVVIASLVTAFAITVIVVAAPSLVQTSIAQKQYVAGANVTSRFTSWTMAAEMTADSPLVGQGPGGFRTNFEKYVHDRPVDQAHLDVAHQMYLDVSSELGLLGLAAFVAMLSFGVRGAFRGSQIRSSSDFGRATILAFAGTLVAASFLSEQYYLPIWLLVAFGVALDPIREGSS